jgi:tripartite-type tricarboxylate transporter receptor subunit TctC
MASSQSLRLFAVCAFAISTTTAAWAETVEDFYRGKTISLVVSSATGGGYDLLSRVVAKHMPKHIPGNPNIVVRNMPGAGGVVATNHLYNVASKDGLTFGQLQNTLPFEPLLGNKEAMYDSSKFNWLGSQSYETGLFIVWNKTPVDSVADATKREVSVGSPGLNSTPSFNTRLLAETLGMKLRIVLGYPGQNEVFLAMERGEVDAFPTFYSSLVATRPNWIKEGKVKMLVQYGPEREPAIKDVPFAADLVTDPERQTLLRAAAAPLALGRPFAAPPGVPADKVETLRKAMADTFADPEYLAEVTKLNLPVNRPRTGSELQAIIDEVWHMPDAAKERLRKLSGM